MNPHERRHTASHLIRNRFCTESYFSLLKRGLYGRFHHISKKRRPRYCVEFDFGWNGNLL